MHLRHDPTSLGAPASPPPAAAPGRPSPQRAGWCKAWEAAARAARAAAVRAGTAAVMSALAACGGGGAADVGSPAPAPPAGGGTAPVLPAVDVSTVGAADPGSTLPAGWSRGPFMQVFVRSYQDSDGDGIGDLRGLISRLDHLQDLGIRGLWLMPVTRSQDRDHGYAVTDYRDIEPAYGTLADVDALLREAHARGIGVILDHVVNHSAAEHPLFQNARSAADNRWRDWYVWSPGVPGGWSVFGGNPWRSTPTGAYYAPFWDQMPDFNLRNPAVVAFHQDHLRFWLNRGVDGFRFDAVSMLVENGPSAWENQPESRAVMAELRRTVEGYRNRWLVCEAPGDVAGFAAPDACGHAFDFGLKDALVLAARGQGAAVQTLAAYAAAAPAGRATLLANHDSFAGARLWDQFAGETARLRLASAALLLLPGVPFLYYGEEIGMAGAATLSGDPRLRTPMSWTADPRTAGFTTGTPYRALSANATTHNVAAQRADPDSLLAHYRGLIALRHGRSELVTGAVAGAVADGLVLAFERRDGAARSLVALNHASGPLTWVRDGLPPGARLRPLWPATGGTAATADAAGRLVLTLPPLSAQVWSLEGATP